PKPPAASGTRRACAPARNASPPPPPRKRSAPLPPAPAGSGGPPPPCTPASSPPAPASSGATTSRTPSCCSSPTRAAPASPRFGGGGLGAAQRRARPPGPPAARRRAGAGRRAGLPLRRRPRGRRTAPPRRPARRARRPGPPDRRHRAPRPAAPAHRLRVGRVPRRRRDAPGGPALAGRRAPGPADRAAGRALRRRRRAPPPRRAHRRDLRRLRPPGAPRPARGRHQGLRAGRHPARVHPPLGHPGDRPPRRRAAPGVQEAVPDLHRPRLVLARGLGPGRPLPPRVHPRRHPHRPLGHPTAAGPCRSPKVIRRAVVADPGWRLVVADADQMEPRVLAAISRDPAFMEVAGRPEDLYTAVSRQGFSGDRDKAKIAVLGAVYGQTSGDGLKNLAALRRRFPRAVAYVDDAARAGEEGRLVRTWLGRTCPPPVGAAEADEAGIPQEQGPERADSAETGWTPSYASANTRARGRFTRNFVVQGSAADWALLMLAALRQATAGMRAELVFFQHDEVIVHCPAEEAEAVVEAVRAAGDRAGRITFGDTPVRFPFTTAVVECYADAK
ncbi:LOW QUALITY PROTEIN: DNA polymerase I, partial [Streptomyces sp. C]